MNIYKQNKFLLLIILVILSLSYIYNLAGDLSYLKRYGDFGDEGYWLQNPISKIKFGKFLIDDQSQSFFGAPIYNLFIYLFLKYFGISFFNARLLSVILLLLTCIVIYKILIKLQFSKYASIVISICFILLYDNRISYQWSTPVPLEILFQSIFIYKVLFNKLRDYKYLLNILILFLLCYNAKATSIFLFPFTIFLIFFDNIKNLVWIKKILFFIFPVLIFFFLRNYYFNLFYHDEYQSFNKFLFATINLNIKQTLLNLNPYFIILSSIQTLKFPNSTLIYTTIIIFFLLKLKFILNLNTLKSIIIRNRPIFILVLYIISFISFLFFTNSYGYDRRQINLILPFYLLFIILLPKFSLSNNKVIFLCIFIFIFTIQAKFLFQYLQFSSNITLYKLFIFIFVIFVFLITCLTIYFKDTFHLFLIFIITNLSFHLIFNRNTNTLQTASHSIGRNIVINTIITGVNAHQLSIENNLIPIWWLNTQIHNTFPNWNSKYIFFKKNRITIVSTDMQNNFKNGYFNSIPINFNLFRSDTIFLNPKFDKSGYLDTNIIKYYHYKL